MPFAFVAVEEIGRRDTPDRGAELPAQVHRIAEPEVEPLAAQRRMNVRGIAGQQHATPSVGGGLPGAIGPGGRECERRHRNVGAGDLPQHRLDVIA